jgi:hypothetical protein
MIKAHLKSSSIQDCHSQRRFSDACFNATSVVPYPEYMQIKLFAENHPAYINNDDCVRSIVSPAAWFFDVNCPGYGCSSGLVAPTCAHYNEQANVVQLVLCPKGQTCDLSGISTNLENDSKCIATPPPSSTKAGWPLDACVTGADCLSALCVAKKCQGVPEGSRCSPGSCGYGYRCSASTSTCQSQIKTGEYGCNNDYDCVNNAGCVKIAVEDEGICITYFSAPVGSYISCFESDLKVNYLCE